MNPDRIRMLVVGDAVAPTGFARVLHCIIERLKHRYEVHHLGINYSGDPHRADWPIYPAGLGGDVFGVNRLDDLLVKLQPSLVLLVYDLWVLARYAAIIEKHRGTFASVAYFPVDGLPVDPDIAKPLQAIDRLVAYNEFGAAAMRSAIEAAAASDSEIKPRDIAIIPHGVETGVFFPLPGGRPAAKRQLFPPQPELLDSFVVLNANRNQPRKRIDMTVEGFARFAAGKPPNVKLYLHMGREDMGWDLVKLARHFGIEERLILTTTDPAIPIETPDRLNLIYNACDVGLNTSSGEGWGLVSFEHAATGAAQIVPHHTACAELWQDAAEFVEPGLTLINEKILTSAHIVTPAGVAAAMERLYRDPAHRADYAERAFRNATRPEYDWDVIAAQWDRLFQTMLKHSQ
jgi:glycosyltransferase involved in cell wall biosynthesis